MKKLPLGKVPKDVLLNFVLKDIHCYEDVLLPPAFGEDGAVVKSKDNIIIAASDPITGASEDAGWLSVHVNANDIAVHAAYPKWYLATLLFPPNTVQEDIANVMRGIKKGLEEVRASLIGGHTEITDKVKDVVIIGAMIGEPMIPGKFITSSGAKPGDDIILTKGAGIEGTLILAVDFEKELVKKVDKSIIENAKKFRNKISVLPEIKTIIQSFDIEYIHAMHDVTEGGLLGGVHEMAYASQLGFEIYEEKIPILKETKEICKVLNLDPLKLISSGSLLIATDPTISANIVKMLKQKGINAAIIGHFIKENPGVGYLIKRNGSKEIISEPPIDELWRFLSMRSI